MKVLYLTHQFYPEYQAGTEKFVFNCASMNQKTGNKVKVITYNLESVENFTASLHDVQYSEYFYGGLNVLAYRYPNDPGDLHFNIDSKLGIEFARAILQREKPDIIHAGHLMRVYPFIFAARELGIPYIITLTDFHLICPKIMLAPTPDTLCSGPEGGAACRRFCSEFPEKFIMDRLALTRDLLLGAEAVYSPSKFLADMFDVSVADLKVIVNNHGIMHSNIVPHRRFYNKEDKIRFGFVGFLGRHKGTHVLINAFNELRSPHEAHLKIFGGGGKDYFNQLNRLANGDSRIEFAGTFHSSELPQVFSSMDVLVIPSIWYENYPFTIVESLASEVPVIASDLGGMKERVINDFNGFTFFPGDSTALAEVMQRIVDNPEILNSLKENIRIKQVIPTVEQEMYVYWQKYNEVLGIYH